VGSHVCILGVCNIKYPNIHIFQYHVFSYQKVNSKVKQLLQLNYASEQFENVHAPTSRCTLGAQKSSSILDKFLVTGSYSMEMDK
jgi:hypothetical protein